MESAAGWATGLLGFNVNNIFAKKHGGKKRGPLADDAANPRRAESAPGSSMETSAERARARDDAELTEEKAALLASDAKAMAQYLLKQNEDAHTFGEWLHGRFKELGLEFPTVTVAYRDLNVEAEAAVGKAAIPTLKSFFLPCAGTSCGGLRKGGDDGGMRATVINKATGVLRPGRLTLLLGPPGAGKSVLLRRLTGQLEASPTLELSGEVKYNGRDPSTFDLERTAAFVDQYDVHMPLLTVHETLLFARRCMWASGCKNMLEAEAEKLLAHEVHNSSPERRRALELHGKEIAAMMARDDLNVEATLALLGLEHCRDTIVGDAMIRGISGGERRRLTCGEVLVGDREFIAMDEISTGLDSATTASVVRFLGYYTRCWESTMVISLLQPSTEVMDLFDDLLLLAQGRVLYHGPVQDVLPHFSALGFDCPSRKEPPSFLQEITFPIGQAELSTSEFRAAHKAAPGGGLLMPLDDMAAAFWSSEKGAELKKAVEEAEAMQYGGPKVLVEAGDPSPWLEFFKLSLWRQFKLTVRDAELVQGRIIQVLVLNIIIGTLFVRMSVEASNTFKFMAASFMSLAVMIFITMPLMAAVFAQKSVFLKHRSYRFCPPSAYALSFCLVEVPITVVCGILSSVLCYWLCNFAPSAGRFFMFLLQLCMGSLTFGSLFIWLAAATPSMTMASGMGAMIELVVILLSGFALIRPLIGGWWIWLYYINPMSWIFRCITINEFTSPRWNGPALAVDGQPLGHFTLNQWGMWPNYHWVWGGVIFSFGFYFICLALICVSFAWTKLPPKKASPASTGAPAPVVTTTAAKSARSLAAPNGTPDAADAKLEGKQDGSGNGSDAELGGAPAAGGGATLDVVEFTPITLVFRNIKYFVPKPSWSNAPEAAEHPGCVQLLKDVSGMVTPGQLVCLMGASGAGKTTLLDVIAGRKTQGIIEGEILLNGHPKEEGTWKRVSAYVEQMDILSATATVWETLLFSARLRNPSTVTADQLETLCTSVMHMVELGPLKDSLVGQPGLSGLALEARKRLSIASELVANPSVIFMDEPTSGLDANAASVVMRVARNIAHANRTILATIHQPSAEIFQAFDSVLLLQRGGRTIYFGPLGMESRDLLAFLNGLGAGLREITKGENSANYMMEVTAGESPDGRDFADLWEASEARKAADEAIAASVEKGAAGPAPAAPGTAPGATPTEYATPRTTQLRMLFKRHALHYWRLPEYNGVRLLLTFGFAVFMGTLFVGRGQVKPGASFNDMLGVLNMIFLALSNLGAVNLLSIIDVAANERAVLYRERASGQYSAATYVWSAFIVELPYLAAQALIFSPISYWIVQFRMEAGPFFMYLFVFFLSLTLYTSFGHAVLYFSPNVQAAQGLGATILVVLDIFKGFVLPRNQMGWWWRWVWYITPSSWMSYALIANQLGGNTVLVADDFRGGELTPVNELLRREYGYRSSWQWWSVLIVVGMIAVMRIVSVLAVQHINHQKR